MANPFRIYVLHHPASTRARQLADYIYDWFRLANLEGIPVYVRSTPPHGARVPLPPASTADALECMIPLVDAQMVRDVAWHDYLGDLAAKSLGPPTAQDHPTKGWLMFPVALDGSAYNLPSSVSQRNFIRYPAVPEDLDEETAAKKNAEAVEEMLKHLTETMSRDLNARIFPEQAGQKLRIFISYARADGTEVPKALRDYIQGQTQCAAFFDENDIGFGESFSQVLDQNAGEQARALIVVNGDQYADRPWCRWEIGRFIKPNPRPLLESDAKGQQILIFHPALVLDTMSGQRMTRVIPELGQAPTIRWTEGGARMCFSTLMRESLLNARNVLAARQAEGSGRLHAGVIVSRMPGPMALQKLLDEHRSGMSGGRRRKFTVAYPGNGVPLMELRLLETTFANVQFRAFRDVHRYLPKPFDAALAAGQRPLAGKVIAISTGHAEELAPLGFLPQHRDEALIYLLRPLLRLGVDLLYAGRLRPRAAPSGGPAVRNMVITLLNLLGDERREAELNHTAIPASRLYNFSAWPDCLSLTPDDEAARINTCSFVRLLPEHAGLPPWSDPLPERGQESPRYFASAALVYSHMRQLIAQGFDCPVPRDQQRHVAPAALIFVCGKAAGFEGIMPGIMEEFLRAVQSRRPVFVLGGFGGAAGVLARALLPEPAQKDERPAEFSSAFYANAQNPNYAPMLEACTEIKAGDSWKPEQAFDELWEQIKAGRRKGGLGTLMANRLSETQNQKLLTTTDPMEAVHLVWEGMSRLFADPVLAKPRSPKKSVARK